MKILVILEKGKTSWGAYAVLATWDIRSQNR
jgi:hypothetical protein